MSEWTPAPARTADAFWQARRHDEAAGTEERDQELFTERTECLVKCDKLNGVER